MSPRRNLPPLRRCPGCGGDHRSWAEHAPCHRCKGAALEAQNDLATELRDRRLARRQEQLDLLGSPVADEIGRGMLPADHPVGSPVPYGSFPEGF